ncbi:MAG: hypothetical protein ACRCZD_12085 [Phycicoccus sp.]
MSHDILDETARTEYRTLPPADFGVADVVRGGARRRRARRLRRAAASGVLLTAAAGAVLLLGPLGAPDARPTDTPAGAPDAAGCLSRDDRAACGDPIRAWGRDALDWDLPGIEDITGRPSEDGTTWRISAGRVRADGGRDRLTIEVGPRPSPMSMVFEDFEGGRVLLLDGDTAPGGSPGAGTDRSAVVVVDEQAGPRHIVVVRLVEVRGERDLQTPDERALVRVRLETTVSPDDKAGGERVAPLPEGWSDDAVVDLLRTLAYG